MEGNGWFPVSYSLARSVLQTGAVSAAVWFALRMRADRSGVCYPTVATIASDTRLSSASVKRALRELARLSLVSLTRTGRSNSYLMAHCDPSDGSESLIATGDVNSICTNNIHRTRGRPARQLPPAKPPAPEHDPAYDAWRELKNFADLYGAGSGRAADQAWDAIMLRARVALQELGGVPAIIETPAAKIPVLMRDFVAAYRRASRRAETNS